MALSHVRVRSYKYVRIVYREHILAFAFIICFLVFASFLRNIVFCSRPQSLQFVTKRLTVNSARCIRVEVLNNEQRLPPAPSGLKGSARKIKKFRNVYRARVLLILSRFTSFQFVNFHMPRKNYSHRSVLYSFCVSSQTRYLRVTL